MKLLARFASDTAGATAIEYALIGSIISIAIVVGATAVGTQLNVMYMAFSEPFK